MGTAGRVKFQFMALVDEEDLDRLDALRVVMNVSRAELNRRILAGQVMRTIEIHQGARLHRLDVLAARVGRHRAEFVRALVRGRVKVPPLELLEGMTNAAVRAELADTTESHRRGGGA